MNLRQVILTILIGLQALDIGTTEYAIKKGFGVEGNPLWKNEKKRRYIAYPIKFLAPLTLEMITYLSNHPIVQKAMFGLIAIATGISIIVVGNNLYYIFRK